ncbi:hypothetical protein [Streptomyces sp. NPDC096142]|uniref:hypothetical protein n=1 Tax=Streptomyces sp. NPDC096142 TaxID=3366077 RepID=UPI0037F3999C
MVPIGRVQDADVVLARQWKTLWNAHAHVLPLAIKPLTGQFQEAACTLLLNEITESALGMQAVFINELLQSGHRSGDVATAARPSEGGNGPA